MKDRSRYLSLLLLTSLGASAQLPGTVQWNASAHPGTRAGEFVVTLHADVEKGWHVYATTQSPGGPIPLVVRVEQNAPFALSGSISGSTPIKHHDASFNLDTEYFTGTFSLNVPVKAASTGTTAIPLAVRFQMCSETTCMPPKTIHLQAKVSAS